jgi:hypothetical protein
MSSAIITQNPAVGTTEFTDDTDWKKPARNPSFTHMVNRGCVSFLKPIRAIRVIRGGQLRFSGSQVFQ